MPFSSGVQRRFLALARVALRPDRPARQTGCRMPLWQCASPQATSGSCGTAAFDPLRSIPDRRRPQGSSSRSRPQSAVMRIHEATGKLFSVFREHTGVRGGIKRCKFFFSKSKKCVTFAFSVRKQKDNNQTYLRGLCREDVFK